MKINLALRLFTLGLAIGLVTPCVAAASNFTVSPTEVNLSAASQSALVTLKNGGKTTLRFEVTVFSWSESPDGKMVLTPTTDVTFFPKLVELAAGASRNIRVGVGAGVAGEVEKCYRIFVEELPDTAAVTTNAVAIRTKIGVPVFVRPAKLTRAANVESVTVEGGRVLTSVKNTGTLHVTAEAVVVRGLDAAGAEKFTHEGQGWYVLPGATRVFPVTITAEECRSAKTIEVLVRGPNGSIKGSAAVAAGACAAR